MEDLYDGEDSFERNPPEESESYLQHEQHELWHRRAKNVYDKLLAVINKKSPFTDFDFPWEGLEIEWMAKHAHKHIEFNEFLDIVRPVLINQLNSIDIDCYWPRVHPSTIRINIKEMKNYANVPEDKMFDKVFSERVEITDDYSPCCFAFQVKKYFGDEYVTYCEECFSVCGESVDHVCSDSAVPVMRIKINGTKCPYMYCPTCDRFVGDIPSAKKQKRNFKLEDLKYVSYSTLRSINCKSDFKEKLKDKYWVKRGANICSSWDEKYRLHLSSDSWKRIRQRVIERDVVCQYCFTNAAEQVHHLTYDRMGYEDLDDLKGICKFCHGQIPNMYEDWRPAEPTPQMLKNEEYKRALRTR